MHAKVFGMVSYCEEVIRAPQPRLDAVVGDHLLTSRETKRFLRRDGVRPTVVGVRRIASVKMDLAPVEIGGGLGMANCRRVFLLQSILGRGVGRARGATCTLKRKPHKAQAQAHASSDQSQRLATDFLRPFRRNAGWNSRPSASVLVHFGHPKREACGGIDGCGARRHCLVLRDRRPSHAPTLVVGASCLCSMLHWRRRSQRGGLAYYICAGPRPTSPRGLAELLAGDHGALGGGLRAAIPTLGPTPVV